MRKQNLARRGLGCTIRDFQGLISQPAAKRRRVWSFETLEARHFLSASPLEGLLPPGTYSFSSDTPEGLALTLQRELDWAFKATASAARLNGDFATASQWVVRTSPGTSVTDIVQQTGLTFDRPYGDFPDTYIMSSAGIDPLEIDNGLGALDVVTTYFPANSGSNPEPASLPTDDLFEAQWHLLNTEQVVGPENFQEIRGVAGEDINVIPVWQELGYTGEGVIVAVVDTGVQVTHPDLVDNIHPTLRQNLLSGGSDARPGGVTAGDAHGTAVAGLIGAANNGFGTVGVAYNSQIVPVRLIIGDPTNPAQAPSPFLTQAEREYLTFAYENQQIDIYNHSWQDPPTDRIAFPVSPLGLQGLRDSIFLGRGGLGNIHVFAAGNAAGPTTSPGFANQGVRDSARFYGFVNSRYTIGVTGVDHDGRRANADGTITTYPEAGPGVLVAAPTGSYPIDLGNDFSIGSGLWTTDLTGDDGFNRETLESGLEIDNDFLDDVDYTSRMNGTSASAPLVSGVIALMLEANPNLSYRDVQEIMVRSARQTALDESPFFWQTNHYALFRDPAAISPVIYVDEQGMPFDPWFEIYGDGPNGAVTEEVFQLGTFDDEGNFVPPRVPLPDPLWTNGAGYTVSDGRGTFGEEAGLGHGVVDAELAVRMAQQWHLKDQDLPPELSYTTFVDVDNQLFYPIAAAEALSMDLASMRIPGGLGSIGDFADFFEEFTEDFPEEPEEGDDPPPDPREEGPFPPSDPQDWPGNGRGSPIQFIVPPDNLMSVEWVEVKFDLTGDPEGLDFLRVVLTSPDGSTSELNQHQLGDVLQDPFSVQQGIQDGVDGSDFLFETDPPGDINDGDFLTWTFGTNRHWGERSDGVLTAAEAQRNADMYGSPFISGVIRSNGFQPIEGTWELAVENYSDSDYMLETYEVVWHGQRITQGSERIQGFVGVDTNQDGTFVYNLGALGGEPHAANATVELIADVVDGSGDVVPMVVDQFVVGADGNFYFDVLPGNYTVRVRDDLGAPLTMLTDEVDGVFQAEWQISEDDFVYEIVDAEGMPTGIFVPVDIVGVNFLVDPGPPPPSFFYVSGSVFADIDGDGQADAEDPPIEDAIVYVDTNLTGQFEAVGDQFVLTDVNGSYSMDVPADVARRFKLGVVPLNLGWTFSNPDTGIHEIFAQRSETISSGTDFLIQPPSAPPQALPDTPGSVLGFVFSDTNHNQREDADESGLGGVTVFLDLDANGELNRDGSGVPTEPFTTTFDSGAYFFSNVAPGTYRVDIEEPFPLVVSVPPAPGDFVAITMEPGGAVTDVIFGLFNPATRDFGDLPAPFPTLLETDDDGNVLVNGPRHDVVPGFQLGAFIDAELNAQPTDVDGFPTGDNTIGMDEDGVVVLDALGQPGGLLREGTNVLQIEVQGVGGHLHAWMDLNGNQQFDDGEKIIDGDALNPGFHFYEVNIAAGQLPTEPVAARFRWSELESLGFTGNGLRGEIEDYLLATVPPAQAAVSPTLPGDFDSNSVVDELDYEVWKSQKGQNVSAGSGADGNGDGRVTLADYTIWRDHFGQVAASGAAQGGGNYNLRFARQAYAAAAAITASLTPMEVTISPELRAQIEAARGLFNDNNTNNTNTSTAGALAASQTSVGQSSLSVPIVPSSVTESNLRFESLTLEGIGNVSSGPFVVASSSVLLPSSVSSTRQDLLDWVYQEREASSSVWLEVDDAPLRGDGSDEETSDDLALVAALNEEVDWRFP